MAMDKSLYRQVLGYFATGVVVLTTRGSTGLVGLTINSFCSVSLDPPLVLVCIDLNSHTLPGLHESGAFVVNILTEQQEHLSRCFAHPSEARYEHFCYASYREVATGAPVIDGVLAFIDARIVAEYPGGDHIIVLGEVQALGVSDDILPVNGTEERPNSIQLDGTPMIGTLPTPLLYYRGRYSHLALDQQHLHHTLHHEKEYSHAVKA
ncbi:MAG TPA: flavin reductase family protein [Ktedonobacteraceae bacterium]|nr:flavin reductase family protein [Ktedonobacteraceae bacterium]